MVKAGSLKEGWAGTCLLPEELKAQLKLRYDVAEYPFARLARAALGGASKPSPQLARALVQARKGSQETALTRRQNKTWKQSAEWSEFLALYRRFVQEWVLPQFGCDLLVQSEPVLRVVLPDSVAPCKPHCDADYYHDASELNLCVSPIDNARTLHIRCMLYRMCVSMPYHGSCTWQLGTPHPRVGVELPLG